MFLFVNRSRLIPVSAASLNLVENNLIVQLENKETVTLGFSNVTDAQDALLLVVTAFKDGLQVLDLEADTVKWR